MDFLKSSKRSLTRRGYPEKIYSNNGSTFVVAVKWLRRVLKEERLHDVLASTSISWQFNLRRLPWWGGQFELMVGIVEKSLYKTVVKTILTWSELEEVLLDAKTVLNNKPLSFAEDEVQMPILTRIRI